MKTPVYILTGFLGSGKTTLLSKILAMRGGKRYFVLQFEDGEEELDEAVLENGKECCRSIWTKDDLERNFDQVLDMITSHLEAEVYDEIWIEWNGMEPFSRLENILLQLRLATKIYIAKVMYLADASQAALLLGQTGDGPVSQAASCDAAFYWGEQSENQALRLKQKLQSLVPGLPVQPLSNQAVSELLCRENGSPVLEMIGIMVIAAVILWVVPELSRRGVPLMNAFTIFMGIFLQAVPFLILGVLISSAIEVFMPKQLMEKLYPKHPIPAMAAGILSGFFLPVCDCASIPVFRGLLKKGVPLPAAVCFMTAAPVVNPVVALSTFYAFGMSFRAVFYRIGIGVICSFLIGLSFLIVKPKNYLKADTGMGQFCVCGCFEEGENRSGAVPMVEKFLRHASVEFYSVGKYLLIGIGVSTVFQTADLGWLKALGQGALPAAVLAMILLSFLLSLCSSSDAVVARSMSGTFGYVPMLGFLVFGPMMDIKNIMMLNGYFKKGFVIRLALTAFVVCFAVVLLLGPLCRGVIV